MTDNDSITITITVPPQILYNCIQLLNNQKQEEIDTNDTIHENSDNDHLKVILHNLLVYCRESGKFNTDNGRMILDRLSHLSLFTANKYNGYIEFLSFVDKQDYVYQEIIFGYMKRKINNSVYNSYIEDGEEGLFNIVNLLIDAHKKETEDTVDVSDILKDYNDSKEIPNEIDETNKTKVFPEIDNSYLTMIKNMDDDTFNNILDKTGMIEESRQKAHKIRNDIKEGKNVDLQEVYTFTQHFKNNILNSNINFNELLTLFTPVKPEAKKEAKTSTPKKEEPKPAETQAFDFNSLLNTFGPMVNNIVNQAGNNGNNRNARRAKNFQKRR